MIEESVRWKVAVYWPNQGYGGVGIHKTAEAAQAEMRQMRVLFPDNEVHVWKETVSSVQRFGPCKKPIDGTPTDPHPTTGEPNPVRK